MFEAVSIIGIREFTVRRRDGALADFRLLVPAALRDVYYM
jgi:hypothetical protein